MIDSTVSRLTEPITRRHGRSHVGTASGPVSPPTVFGRATAPTQMTQLFPGAPALVAVADQPVAVAALITTVVPPVGLKPGNSDVLAA